MCVLKEMGIDVGTLAIKWNKNISSNNHLARIVLTTYL